MRIARVLHESSPAPLLALEKDGALYSVAELERLRDSMFSPERFAGASDFHARVIALGGAGLTDLDDDLGAGLRPSSARLARGSFLWLPPCDEGRAAYVQMGAYDEPDAGGARGEPRYRIGNARGLLGHDHTVPFPADEPEPGFEIGIAAILREDLRFATVAEAERAILGYAVLNDWTARGTERRDLARGAGRGRSRDLATQLGPVLVTADDVGDVAALRVEAHAASESGEERSACARVAAWRFTLAESIAFVSAHMELRAGDVVGAGAAVRGCGGYGASVTGSIERLGKLSGRPVRGRGGFRSSE